VEEKISLMNQSLNHARDFLRSLRGYSPESDFMNEASYAVKSGEVNVEEKGHLAVQSGLPLQVEDTKQKIEAPELQHNSLPATNTIAAGEGVKKGKKHLCIGLAQRLLSSELAAFVGSFREHVSADEGDVVIFMNSPITERQTEIAEKFNVKVELYDAEKLEPSFLRRYHPSSIRWVLMSRYLDSKGDLYDSVVTADVRDTIFQSDPFSMVEGDGLHVFLESNTIGSCGWNKGWVQDCFGSRVSCQRKKRISGL
jgi:hypothetical protein